MGGLGGPPRGCVSRSMPKEKLGGLAGGRGLQVQASGSDVCVSQHALKQPSPSRRLLLRTVRILLECILVFMSIS